MDLSKILCYFASLRQDGMIQLICINFVKYFFFFLGGGVVGGVVGGGEGGV